MKTAQTVVEQLLASADVRIGGTRPWDIQIKEPAFYRRVLGGGSLALGEAYMDGWWEVELLDEFFSHVMGARLDKKIGRDLSVILPAVMAAISNRQTIRGAHHNASFHYNIGNDLYQAMLDKRMVYTCGYWKNADTLDKAQEDKLDLVCRKLNLRAGQKILDIGCGWGSFAKFAAENYGVSVVGITLAQDQIDLGKKLCEGLPVQLILQDYRQIEGTFDHIVSLGMFEHVGLKNYQTYLRVASEHLADDGLFLLHTIGWNVSGIGREPFLDKYIFPNAHIPSIAQIARPAEKYFVVEDWHNFGADYDRTLMAWWHNFDSHWPELKANYDERFYRMWKFYLLSCAGAFRSRTGELWQIVFSKHGVPGGYHSVR